MGRPNAKRIDIPETNYTFTQRSLAGLLKQLDMQINFADCWSTVTRTNDLISKIEFFSDAAKTNKTCEQNFTRVTGVGGISLVSEIENVFFNDNGSVDSRVISTLNRPNIGTVDQIETTDSPFSTDETPEC